MKTIVVVGGVAGGGAGVGPPRPPGGAARGGLCLVRCLHAYRLIHARQWRTDRLGTGRQNQFAIDLLIGFPCGMVYNLDLLGTAVDGQNFVVHADIYSKPPRELLWC